MPKPPSPDVKCKCLCCDKSFEEKAERHRCPIGFCMRGAHFGFCPACKGLAVASFERQVSQQPLRQPPNTPRLLTEGDTPQ